ncbi:MAG: hypothetical protein ACK4MH_04065 [Brevundimonas sp.]|uniref:hypothetical protein n=1 Tax=Brevundimonas sp. TaxID=1871086 RepID=UPI003918D4EB
MKEFSWGTVLVAAPVAHFFLASVYLYSYCLGFGGNIASFVSAEDVFSTSIRFLAPIYLLIAAASVPTFRQEIGDWLSGTKKPRHYGPSRPIKVPLLFKITAWILAVAPVCSAFLSYSVGDPINVYEMLVGLGGLTMLGASLRIRDDRAINAAFGFLFVTAIVFIIGVNTGQQGRHVEYTSYKDSNPSCKSYAVLRKMSDHYLTIGSDGRHHMIDDECAVRFDIPQVKPGIDRKTLPKFVQDFFFAG